VDSRIKFIELGIESVNDHILRKYRKPSTTQKIIQATDKLRQLPVKLVPDIIIGMPEETHETYQNTLQYLADNRDVISHINVYNLSVYKHTDISQWFQAKEDGDCDEYTIHKSFHGKNNSHQEFHDAIMKMGLDFLQCPIYFGW
jgi:radical SAM superfamily enzyme